MYEVAENKPTFWMIMYIIQNVDLFSATSYIIIQNVDLFSATSYIIIQNVDLFSATCLHSEWLCMK
jgi:hypothetical protein